MTTPKTPDKPSSRHHVVDPRFAALLSEDFGIGRETILLALDAEPKKRAIALCEWAARQDEPAEALVAWAKKHGKGRCRRAARPPIGPRGGTRWATAGHGTTVPMPPGPPVPPAVVVFRGASTRLGSGPTSRGWPTDGRPRAPEAHP